MGGLVRTFSRARRVRVLGDGRLATRWQATLVFRSGTQGLPMSVSRRVGRLRRTGRFNVPMRWVLSRPVVRRRATRRRCGGSPRWVGRSSCWGTSGRLWPRGGSPTCMRTMPVAGSPGGSTIVIPIPVAGCSGVRWSTAFRRFWWGIGGGPRPAFRALPGARRFPWRIIGPMRRRLRPWKQTRVELYGDFGRRLGGAMRLLLGPISPW